ncbi:MAG: glycosyltransferase [Chloroflexi bacterium]|nr:glycosyltransferase [Chloroflexota bacterium]
MLTHMPWDWNLGGPQPQMDLADELRGMGHAVDKFDINDAFSAFPRLHPALLDLLFPFVATMWVRRYGRAYDIIDAHQGNLPFSKRQLHFSGLLCVRSAGLVHFYAVQARRWQTREPRRRPNPRRVAGLALRRTLLSPEFAIMRTERSFRAADMILLANRDEHRHVADVLGYGGKAIWIPHGLSDARLARLAPVAAAARRRSAGRQVVFVGSWSVRKGLRDWPRIVALTRARVPGASFLFLGTVVDAEGVLRDLGYPPSPWIQVIPRFDNRCLPVLLEGAKAGAFPSYIEGFGLAVLEQAAAGVPTVAYDVPGPREILSSVSPSLLVPPGDTGAFVSMLCELLTMDSESYVVTADQSRKVAEGFSSRKVAEANLGAYLEFMQHIRGDHA